MRSDVNLANVTEAFAAALGDADAIVQGDSRVSWATFDRHASGVAAALLGAGLERGARVGIHLHNCPAYLETHIGALKGSFVPFNTNYRYVDEELVHLWVDADAAVVVFHAAFTPTIERIRERVPDVGLWICVADETGTGPDWATPYEQVIATAPTSAPWPRSRDDLVFVYTGGTTGLPKGVMWDQGVYLSQLPDDIDAHVQQRVAATGRTMLPAAPLMHGTGQATALGTMARGGIVVLLPGISFDAATLWSTVEAERATSIAIVGDAFARPMVDALDAEPGRWNLDHVHGIFSAGVMFSAPVKERLLAHLPKLRIVDQFGSSENANGATSVSDTSGIGATGVFHPGSGVRVLDDSGEDVVPGSGDVGVVAIPGGAVGYHKDPEKSARTWPMIDGKRFTIVGDHAVVEVDGTIRLLGRGSVCINAGGEKIFPEEVEEALKMHPDVRDAVVVGIPHERFGESVAAVYESAHAVESHELQAHLASLVARYKVPRHFVQVASMGRAANGKADYAGARRLVMDDVESSTPRSTTL